jgi:ABC-type nitrate/sulfonate/bicarbonate transport system substrate-binding protein
MPDEKKVMLKIGGVPEHFNLPWHLAIERGDFKNAGIDLQWKDYPGGTGAMCTDLRSGELDLAIVLTEGIITDITKGNPSRIIQLFVKTPLIWGIHVPAKSDILTERDIRGKKYAISRTGSGSHLMAYVDAQSRGWILSEYQMVIVNNLEGARKAFKEGKAEVFLWEKFTTQPYVDSGEFRRVGEQPTPWPCFVLAAREAVIQKHPGEIRKIQEIIIKSSAQALFNKKTAEIIAKRYKLKKENVDEWMKQTKWATDILMEKKIINKVSDTLYDLRLIDQKLEAEEMCMFCEII